MQVKLSFLRSLKNLSINEAAYKANQAGFETMVIGRREPISFNHDKIMLIVDDECDGFGDTVLYARPAYYKQIIQEDLER